MPRRYVHPKWTLEPLPPPPAEVATVFVNCGDMQPLRLDVVTDERADRHWIYNTPRAQNPRDLVQWKATVQREARLNKNKRRAKHRRPMKTEAEEVRKQLASGEIPKRPAPPMSEPAVDIRGLDKPSVLLALWALSAAQGISGLFEEMPTRQDAINALANPYRVDYFCGRPIKADLKGPSFDPRLYDRDAGEGQAQRAVNALRRVIAEEKRSDA